MQATDREYSVWLLEMVSYSAMIPLCFVASALFALGAVVFHRICQHGDLCVLAGFFVLVVTECLCCLSGGLCLIFKLSLLADLKPAHNDSMTGNDTELHSELHHEFPLPLMVTFYFTNYLLFVRNYCIVVKSGMTMAHVFVPVRARTYLTKRRVQCAYLSCYLLALAPVLTRFSAEAFSMYVSNESLPDYVSSLSRNHDTVHFVIFALQGPLPAGLAVVMSLVISVKLLRRSASIPNSSSSSRAILSTRAVVRTLLVAFVFAQCEIPTTVLALLDSGEETQNVVLSRVIGNLFIILDSYCNLLIIVLSNRRFLQGAARMLGLRKAARGGPGGRTTNGGGPAENLPLTQRSTVLVRV